MCGGISSHCILMRTIGSFGKRELCRADAHRQTHVSRRRRPSRNRAKHAHFIRQQRNGRRGRRRYADGKRKAKNDFMEQNLRHTAAKTTIHIHAKCCSQTIGKWHERRVSRVCDRTRRRCGERNHNIIQYTLQGS